MDADKDVIENLQDAGCNCDEISEFEKFAKQDDCRAQMRLLCKKRERIVEDIHDDRRKLSCLDYLIYKMRNDGND